MPMRILLMICLSDNEFSCWLLTVTVLAIKRCRNFKICKHNYFIIVISLSYYLLNTQSFF